MKRLIVFDLDGTLAKSKSSLDAGMAVLLHALLGVVKAAVISGGAWPQFEAQVLSKLQHDERLKELSLLPTCGTQFFAYDDSWKRLYSEDLTSDDRGRIVDALKKAIRASGFEAKRVWGDVIEDRGSQITLSALGQQAPLDAKATWDPDFARRKKIKSILDTLIPEFSVRLGGMTSIDVTRLGIDKGYGIGKLRDVLGIPLKEMLFVGDALFVGGNDRPAEDAGVVSIQVRDPDETAGHRDARRVSGRLVKRAFELHRLKVLMEPEPGNPREVEGVLNPAAIRGPDRELYLFPRLTARGNYSRIGIARVRFDAAGDPTGVDRLGIALEPEADYERRPDGGGGCEDPRITFVEPLRCYVMTYTAFSARGPRIALAVSKDLFRWQRLGLATFAPYRGVAFDGIDDKDASLFPVAIPNPSGQPELAILHRPLFPGTRPEETASQPATRKPDLDRESIWISYCPMILDPDGDERLGRFTSHHRLASPVSPWEQLKIGGGAPPVMTRHGWLVVYHGVSALPGSDASGGALRYSAGVMVLSKDHPRSVRYRSREPVLTPELPDERRGTVGNVVFPSGIDRRDDLGLPDRLDVYYGMADNRIGVARLDVPERLPPEEVLADGPDRHLGAREP